MSLTVGDGVGDTYLRGQRFTFLVALLRRPRVCRYSSLFAAATHSTLQCDMSPSDNVIILLTLRNHIYGWNNASCRQRKRRRGQPYVTWTRNGSRALPATFRAHCGLWRIPRLTDAAAYSNNNATWQQWPLLQTLLYIMPPSTYNYEQQPPIAYAVAAAVTRRPSHSISASSVAAAMLWRDVCVSGVPERNRPRAYPLTLPPPCNVNMAGVAAISFILA